MLVPLSWLKDYVDIDVTPDVLEEKLFSCGFEVEEKYEVGKDISKVVVGEVKTCEPIEGTHLHLCTVDAGENGILQICCGADNVAAGGKYPLALIGAQVYATAKDHVTVEGVMTIGQGKLRGYDSYGMLCSGVEIVALTIIFSTFPSRQTDLTASRSSVSQERLPQYSASPLRSLLLITRRAMLQLTSTSAYLLLTSARDTLVTMYPTLRSASHLSG